MKKTLSFLLFLSCFHFSTAAETKTIRLVSGPDYLPLVDESDPRGGIATALIREAFASQGYDISLTVQPWIRGAEATKNGTFDATFPYLKSPEREKDFLFSNPFFSSPSRLFVLKSRHYTRVEELQGKTLCSPLGYDRSTLEPFIRKYDFKIVSPTSLNACFEMLHLGRIDAIPLCEHVGQKIIEQQSKYRGAFETIEGLLPQAQYYLMVGKSNPRGAEIIEAFNKGLKKNAKRENSDAYKTQSKIIGN